MDLPPHPHPPNHSTGAPRRSVPAWLLSVSLHAAVVLLLGVLLQVDPRGTEVEGERPAGLVLVSQQQGQVAYLDAGEQADRTATQASPTAAASLVESLPGAAEAPADAVEFSAPASATPQVGEVLGGLPGAGELTQSPRPGRGQHDYGIETGVFGVSGRGSRFVYVFDRSGSMEGYQGRPLRAAKSELLQSVASLRKTHQFQIIFYNEKPEIFNPDRPRPARMLFATEQNQRLAERYVGSMIATGGTKHLEALEMGLNLNPEVLFFLTDAAEPQLNAAQLAEIQRRNSRINASINTIEFGEHAAAPQRNFLMRLAEQNRGQYVYVDVTRLPQP